MTPDKPKHDKIFRKSMENPIVAKEFLATHLPKDVLALIDSTTLKLEKDSFIEPNLSETISDVLFSVKFNDTDGYIFLLLEHQSTVDQLMIFRLFKYMVNICNLYLTTNPKAKRLPLIYPLVLYNGKKKYDAPLNIWELLDFLHKSKKLSGFLGETKPSTAVYINVHEERRRVSTTKSPTRLTYAGSLFTHPDLARYFWTNDCQLVNVHDIPDEELKKKVWSGILLFFLKHIHERQLLKRWQEISYLLLELSKITIGYDHIRNLLQYTLIFIEQSDKIELEKILKNSLTKEKGEELMPSMAQVWKEEGIQIGLQDGIKIGEARGKVEAMKDIEKTMLLKHKTINEIIELTGLSKEQIERLK